MRDSADMAAESRRTTAAVAAAFLYDQGARAVWLFGSLSRARAMDRLSDVDLAVEGLEDTALRRFTEELRARLHCRLHIVSFDTAGPALRNGIVSGRVLLHRSDTAASAVAGKADSDRRHLIATLHRQRFDAILDVLERHGARSVADLGCGNGALLIELARLPAIARLCGVDFDRDALKAARASMLQSLSGAERAKIDLSLGVLTNAHPRLGGFDAITMVESIEHLDPALLPRLAHAVFCVARPRLVVITTPNRDFNPKWKGVGADRLRLQEHRFEWTRVECSAWAWEQATRYGYSVEVTGVGPHDPAVGQPTHLLVFERAAE
jgi:3' terminal RNA ribose 2'-O-methyltransferase Hen1